MNKSPLLELNNGIKMPQLGLGAWKDTDDEAEAAVAAALKAGYRQIDTAMVYGNEVGVGRAIQASGIPREEIFITTKVWNADQDYDKALAAFDKSLVRLGLDYIDLYLIHWPMPKVGKFAETWRALEKLYEDKRVRSIGVSNFEPNHLDELLKTAKVVPAVNQIELHPNFQQRELRAYCDQHNIKVESWSPLGGVKASILDDPTLSDIAKKHGKTSAQVAIRWHIQNGLIVIPKSKNEERIKQNIDVFDFELDDEDLAAIDKLDGDNRNGAHPDDVNFT